MSNAPAQKPAALVRPIDEINAEYNSLAAQAGDLAFKILQDEGLLQRIQQRMAQLRDEQRVAQIQAAEKEHWEKELRATLTKAPTEKTQDVATETEPPSEKQTTAEASPGLRN